MSDPASNRNIHLIAAPFTSPEAFQTMQEVEDYRGGQRIQCLICGKYFGRLLHKHLNLHKITHAEYHERFGIPFYLSLTSRPSREKTAEKCGMNSYVFALHPRKKLYDGPRKKWMPASKSKTTGEKHHRRAKANHVLVPCTVCGAPTIVTKNSYSHKLGYQCDTCCTPQQLKWRSDYWIETTGSYPPPHRQAILEELLKQAA